MQHCVSSERTAILLKMLDFTPNHLQKVLVFTDSVDEVEMVHQVTKQPNLACNITVKKKKKDTYLCVLSVSERQTKEFSCSCSFFR